MYNCIRVYTQRLRPSEQLIRLEPLLAVHQNNHLAQPTCALQAGGLPAKLTHVMVWFMNCYCYSEYYNYFFLDWVEGVKAI